MDGIHYYYSREVTAADRDNTPTYDHRFDDAEPSHYREYETNRWETDPVDAASLGNYSPSVMLLPDLVPEPQYSSHSNSSPHAFQRDLSRHSRYPPSHDSQARGRQHGAGTTGHSNGHDWMFPETVEHEWDHPNCPIWNTPAAGHHAPESDDAYVLVGAADTSPPSARVSQSPISHPITCLALK
jgi:hypothetical protein